jgi:hypothetical protein
MFYLVGNSGQNKKDQIKDKAIKHRNNYMIKCKSINMLTARFLLIDILFATALGFRF